MLAIPSSDVYGGFILLPLPQSSLFFSPFIQELAQAQPPKELPTDDSLLSGHLHLLGTLLPSWRSDEAASLLGPLLNDFLFKPSHQYYLLREKQPQVNFKEHFAFPLIFSLTLFALTLSFYNTKEKNSILFACDFVLLRLISS